MLAVTSELLTTVVVTAAPLKTTTDEATNWLPVAVSTKLEGSWENVMVVGEIELRTGFGRELPQRGFSALQPGSSRSTASQELKTTIRHEVVMNRV